MPRLIASRTEKAMRPIEPFSRIVVTPEWSIARALTVALMSSRSSPWAARSSPRVPSPMPTRWVCPSTSPGRIVASP